MAFDNGKKALHYILGNPANVSLGIFDKVMPEMSGPEAIKELRKNNIQIPLIGLTGM